MPETLRRGAEKWIARYSSGKGKKKCGNTEWDLGVLRGRFLGRGEERREKRGERRQKGLKEARKKEIISIKKIPSHNTNPSSKLRSHGCVNSTI